MTKKEFVQRAAIQFLDNESPCVDRAISWAERLWQRLSERGYGPAKEQGPRQHIDWYSRLSDEQRAYFDRFWKAFNLKRGKQRAAMRWGQICPDAETAEHIIEAAAAEAKRKLPEGQVRKMAEGWLAERRWEDFTPSRHEQAERGADERAQEIRRLRAEAAHLERMLDYERHGETAAKLREQLADLRGRLAALGVNLDA